VACPRRRCRVRSSLPDAIPLILQRGANWTLFVPTGSMGRPHPDLPQEMIMCGEDLLELSAEGVEIGAHTVEHLWLPRMSYEQVLDQMRRSRATLEDLTRQARDRDGLSVRRL
jgi:peptidoglycan/xylan/chitin deacetylase (PgdA/CDA1 family)